MGLPLLTGSIMTGLDIKSGEDPGRAVAGTVGGMVTSGAAFAAGSLLPIPGVVLLVVLLHIVLDKTLEKEFMISFLVLHKLHLPQQQQLPLQRILK